MKNDVAGLDEWKTERFRDCSLLQTRGLAGERASMNDPLFWIGVRLGFRRIHAFAEFDCLIPKYEKLEHKD
jgi:hypothetical protein